MLNVHSGGGLIRIEGHVATRHYLNLSPNWLPDYEQKIEVNSFHNFGVSQDVLAGKFTPVATSDGSLVEAIEDLERRIVGVMWHPERNAPFSDFDIHIFNQHFGLLPSQT